MADTVQQLLRTRIGDSTPAVKYGDRVWSWREHLTDASAAASALIGIADPERPLHVGALLGNTPEMLTAMAAAALGGYVLCGINETRRGAALAKDIVRADCQILLTDPAHRALLDGLELPGVRVLDIPPQAGGAPTTEEWSGLLAAAGPLVAHREVNAGDTFMMIFTSGTSGEPKAVQVTHLTVIFAGSQPDRAVRRRVVRRLLPVDAAFSLQRVARRLECGRRLRRGDGACDVLGVRFAV